MMNLTDLVPPMELCKLIPEGEFADTVLIWGKCADHDGQIFSSKSKLGKMFEIYPAPTLQEILKELDEFEVWGNNISDEHTVVSEFVQYEDENTATAALKVWLKLKGIEE